MWPKDQNHKIYSVTELTKEIQTLLEEEAILSLYDPKAMDNMKTIFPDKEPHIQYASSPNQSAENANALLIVTEWEEFKNLDLKKISC